MKSTIVLPIPTEDAPPREWALYLAACAAHRGNSALAGLWEQVAATFAPNGPDSAESATRRIEGKA